MVYVEVELKIIEFASYPKFIREYVRFLEDNPQYVGLDPLEVLPQFGIRSAILIEVQGSYARQQNEYHQISDEDYTWFILRWS
jgi:hypothetical protein